jgi:hypothetical protein
LVSKLKAASVNPEVGVREMDTGQAGYVTIDGASEVGKTNPPVIRLEGALRTPATESTPYAANGESDDFQRDVASLLSLYDEMSSSTVIRYGEAKMDGDQVLTIPLYGHSYANSEAGPPVTRDGKNWYSAINFDPRNRVAAGLGTRVVENNQEELMSSAWRQLQVLQKARNNFGAVGIIMDRMVTRFKDETLVPQIDFVSMSRKILPRVKALNVSPSAAPVTIFAKLNASPTPNAMIESATRRVMRPGGSVSNRLRLTTAATPAPDSKANSNLQALNVILTKDNAAVLTGFRFRKIDMGGAVVGNTSGGVLLDDDFEETAFGRAFRHFTTRSNFTPPLPGRAFDFTLAASAIFRSISLAPVQLFKAQLKLPAEQPAFGDRRPPAELLGQPFFPRPMYEPLWQLNKEWFLPNLNLIENNTVTLLETNTHFINAYMVGLNHEMGREMLWREFPAELSATYFRNFWSADDVDASAVSPRYYDIEPIENWLGAPAPSRESTGDEPRLVLTLRGDLLRKFPGTVIFVANLKRDSNGRLAVGENTDFRFPLFRADLPPDLQFVGFDLLVEQVLETANDSSWYFVLMEPVGEPRFGLDAVYRPVAADRYDRSDLAWEHLGGDFLTATQKPNAPNMPDSEKNLWGADAAAMAALLFQQPFAQFIKATDLLNER